MAALFALPATMWAQAQTASQLDERTQALALALRCLVCQNQSVADSLAPLALQLKAEIKRQLAQGASDEAVRQFMLQRYGDFVLYKPPVKRATWLLWGGPLLFLLAGGAAVATRLKAPVQPDTR